MVSQNKLGSKRTLETMEETKAAERTAEELSEEDRRIAALCQSLQALNKEKSKDVHPSSNCSGPLKLRE